MKIYIIKPDAFGIYNKRLVVIENVTLDKVLCCDYSGDYDIVSKDKVEFDLTEENILSLLNKDKRILDVALDADLVAVDEDNDEYISYYTSFQ